jgi:hypothetical protein
LKFWIVVLIPVFLYCSTPACADGVSLEGGQGFHHSTNSQAIFLGYQIDSPQLLGLDSYWVASLGAWNGPERNTAVILAKGVSLNLDKKWYISFEPGGACIGRTTNNLGTRLEFAIRTALGIKSEKYDLSVGYKHFSNGKGIFHWTDTPNFGENFITLQICYLL